MREGRLTILLSGCWNERYNADHTIKTLESLASDPVARLQKYLVHGSEAPFSWFDANEFEYTQVRWVEDYVALLQDVDIQIFPIAIGTGTKGKVLSALALGVTCIGSLEAFANIRADIGWPHLVYEAPAEVGPHIQEVCKANKSGLKRRQTNVIKAQHAASVVASKFWRDL